MKKSLLTILGFLTLQQSYGIPPISYKCQPGTPEECKKAMFVPGHTLLGEGINIVTMKTTGSFLLDLQSVKKNCTLCNNPHHKNALQKLPLGLVDWRPESSCSQRVISSTSSSTASVANDASSRVTNDWSAGLEGQYKGVTGSTAYGGSLSEQAKFAKSKSYSDKYSFLMNKLECTYYSSRLSSTAPLTSNFADALRKLPDSYNPKTKSEYMCLIRQYGTHYITYAKTGGRAQEITAVKKCELAVNGLTVDEVKDCLNVEAATAVSSLIKSASMRSKANHCKQKSRNVNYQLGFHESFTERIWEVTGGHATDNIFTTGKQKKNDFDTWIESLKTIPGLVSFSLNPIHNLVRFSGPQKNNLRLAVSDYIKEKVVKEKCSCPSGSYLSPRGDCSCLCRASKYTNSDCCTTGKGVAKLHVTIIRGQKLYGDVVTNTDGYVKFKFGSSEIRTRTINNNNNPQWGATYDMGMVILSSQKKYKIEVWDEDVITKDDFLGSCEKVLKSGGKTEICYLKHGSVTYSLRVTCATNLRGQYCGIYHPVPPK